MRKMKTRNRTFLNQKKHETITFSTWNQVLSLGCEPIKLRSGLVGREETGAVSAIQGTSYVPLTAAKRCSFAQETGQLGRPIRCPWRIEKSQKEKGRAN